MSEKKDKGLSLLQKIYLSKMAFMWPFLIVLTVISIIVFCALVYAELFL